MANKQRIKIAVALSERKKDFDIFREEVYSSKILREKVDLIPSLNKQHLKQIIPDAEILVCFSIEKKTFLSAKKLKAFEK